MSTANRSPRQDAVVQQLLRRVNHIEKQVQGFGAPPAIPTAGRTYHKAVASPEGDTISITASNAGGDDVLAVNDVMRCHFTLTLSGPDGDEWDGFVCTGSVAMTLESGGTAHLSMAASILDLHDVVAPSTAEVERHARAHTLEMTGATLGAAESLTVNTVHSSFDLDFTPTAGSLSIAADLSDVSPYNNAFNQKGLSGLFFSPVPFA